MQKSLTLPTLILLLGSVTLFAFFSNNKPNDQQLPTAEKINLALRQTAHFLLKDGGDSTSRIDPVQNPSESVYTVHLERYFNYDSLPVFLNRSFKAYNIDAKYDVSVWDCDHKVLVLGYTSSDFESDKGIPCGGRETKLGCYKFTVTFANPNTSPSIISPSLSLILLGLAMVSILLYAYFLWNKKQEKPIITAESLVENEHLISIGESIFNPQKQTLVSGSIAQNLTYREAKLLHLFCNHKNELLDRDFILKHVWEDEGILVGRSLDVFVSRLRKLLKHDDALKITNIHGRGYRFEVNE